jgi:O-methyltransferase involved in polyketide biosynthesis
VDLHGAAATMLATLYGRALDARSPHPVLGDAAADRAVAALDHDWSRVGVGPRDALGIAARAKLLDRWTREFLAVHPAAVVLHLGCGLDSRFERIAPGPDVLWFDVDQPEVVALHARVFPPAPGRRTVAASVLDPAWLARVPRDRPAFVVAEGLTMYLPAAEGPVLLRRLVAHLPSGGMAFDSYSRLGVRLSRRMPVLRRAGARLDWGIDDPHEPERLVPGLRLVEGRSALRALDAADLARAPRSFRWQLAVLGRTPLLRAVGHLARYAFG